MGRKAVERVGCDRMGEVHGKNERDSWEEWEGMLRHIGKVT